MKQTFTKSIPNDIKGSLGYRSVAQDRYQYSKHGRELPIKTKHYSNATGETTSVRFGKSNERVKKSGHVLDLRKSPKSKALEKAKGLKEAEHRGNAMRMRKHEEMKKRYPHLIKP